MSVQPFELESLNEQELRILYQKVLDRILLLANDRTKEQLEKFQVGQIVWFLHSGKQVYGEVIKCNRKTVSVLADDGVRWRVAPSFLHILT